MYWVGERCIRGETVAQAAVECIEAVSYTHLDVYKRQTIRKASPLVSEVKLFDIYRGANLGDGKKSMAFSPVSYTHLSPGFGPIVCNLTPFSNSLSLRLQTLSP